MKRFSPTGRPRRSKETAPGKAEITVLTARLLRGRQWLLHGFSTRKNGFSTVYGGQDLNLGFTEEDKRRFVEENHKAFLQALSPAAPRLTLITVKQVHSDVVHVLCSPSTIPLRGDGMITNVPGFLLGVRTADCVPVLIADIKRKAVGAFHAGWRGTLQRIVEKGLGRMQVEYASNMKDIRAVIGPCIHACCYAVGNEVGEQYQSQFNHAHELFTEVCDEDPVRRKYPLPFLSVRAKGHGYLGPEIHLDLVKANQRQLIDAGVKIENIEVLDYCTSCRKDLLFSHRAQNGFTGRMLSVIGISSERYV